MTLERTILPLNLFTICINPKEHNNFSRELFIFSCNIKKESNKVKENSGRRCKLIELMVPINLNTLLLPRKLQLPLVPLPALDGDQQK